MRFEIYAGRKITGSVFARISIGGNAELVGNWLLKTELSAGARRCRNDIFCKVITAARNARFTFESFAHLRVGVITDVVAFIANWNKHIVADDNLQPFFAPL